MFSHLSFDCVLLWLLPLTRSLEGSRTAEVGKNAYLPCHYFPTTSENLVPMCWGRGPCPLTQCTSVMLSTDGRHLNYQSSSRYQLKGNVHKGDVSLTIENVTLADSGTYCCRIQFPGPMNDKKSNLELDIKPALCSQRSLLLTLLSDTSQGHPCWDSTESLHYSLSKDIYH
uniref:Ig-like domain-containing protein n=1 Tax=Myotis myotis TaxID=51298 RepID=A0A7J7XG45_MYOMY|nr:hypothetical protein mMyoMyo1_006180 [Myotis myotis]